MISCGHCGGRHATVAEVRRCSDGRASSDPAGAPDPTTPGSAPRVTAPSAAEPPVPLAPDWARLAGPAELGRGLVVRAGDSVPAPWVDAPRLAVRGDDPAPPPKLSEARARRERIVVELDGEIPTDPPVLRTEYWHLAPDTDLGHETTDHVVFENAIDARDPSRPTFRPVTLAVAAGATVAETGPGEIVAAGRPMWCDGGPLDWPTLDAPIVPAVHLARGSLAPVADADPAADLAPDQLAAVAHRGGGARIIAPAGSGKTRVLTERARHLVRDRGIDPSAVCLVAFNVRAREEMEARTADLVGLEIRTLNSLALALLSGRGPFRPPADRPAPRVIDERDVRRLLDDLVPRGRRRAMTDPHAVWLEALTASRLGLRAPEAVEREFGGDVKGFAEVLPAYRAALRDRGLVDFDEQILGAIEVLCTDPAARTAARRACGLLLVDEFQDLTPAHVLLVRLLAGPAADVFGVGDDDQTIYGYSGASPEWLLDFAELFDGAGTHDLRVNYRCPPEVVRAAANLLTRNRRRIDKTIEARPGRPLGPDADPPPLAVRVADEPLRVTVERVRALFDAGVPPSDIAVLTRVNATLLGPMLALAEAGVPTDSPIDRAFLDRTGVASALAWLRLATAPEQRLSGADIGVAARRPPRALRPMIVDWMSERSSPAGLQQLAGRLREESDAAKLEGFVDDLLTLRARADDGATTAEILAAVRDDVGLGAALDQRLDASRRSVDRSAHGDDLTALRAVAVHEPDPARFPGWLADRLAAARPDHHGVRLATVHRVKGREWPHVIVHEATAGLFPHRLAADREEERRVFHVALTRGADTVLVAAGDPPSPFLAELDEPRDVDAEPPQPPRRRAPGPATRLGPAEASWSADDAALRERLRTWRSATAQAAGVPAYVVFNDATLDDLVARRPTNEAELVDVTGIGPVKVERYGEAILGIVAEG